MQNEIISAFEAVTMPADCERKVRLTLSQGCKSEKTKLNYFRIAATAACLVAFVLLLCSPATVEAVENRIQKITVVTRNTHTRYRFTREQLRLRSLITYRLETRSGRLWYVGNEEETDITELISVDKAFTHIYEDAAGVKHYVCIGGAYDPDPEKSNIGYAEWQYDPAEDKWLDGYANNYWNKDTDSAYTWFQTGKEALGIPWP